MKENKNIKMREIEAGGWCSGIHANRSILLQCFHTVQRGKFIVPGKQFIRHSTTQGQFTCISFEKNSSPWDCPLACLPPPPPLCVFHHLYVCALFLLLHLIICLTCLALMFYRVVLEGFIKG